MRHNSASPRPKRAAACTLKDSNGATITAVPYTLPSSIVLFRSNSGFAGVNSFNYEVTEGTTVDTGLVTINIIAGSCAVDPAFCDEGRQPFATRRRGLRRLWSMRTAAANLARIMIRPRETMRRILDAGRDRMILPLVALAAVSGFVGDFNRKSIDALSGRAVPPALLIAGLVLVSICVAFIFFYLASWAAFGVGKVLEGTGTPRDLRSAIAWGLAPIIWALLYRLPAVFLVPRPAAAKVKVGGTGMTFDPGRFGTSCGTALFFGALELAVLIWCVSVASNTIGEAHRFSSWRGLATLVVVVISPLLIVLAAVLAM